MAACKVSDCVSLHCYLGPLRPFVPCSPAASRRFRSGFSKDSRQGARHCARDPSKPEVGLATDDADVLGLYGRELLPEGVDRKKVVIVEHSYGQWSRQKKIRYVNLATIKPPKPARVRFDSYGTFGKRFMEAETEEEQQLRESYELPEDGPSSAAVQDAPDKQPVPSTSQPVVQHASESGSSGSSSSHNTSHSGNGVESTTAAAQSAAQSTATTGVQEIADKATQRREALGKLLGVALLLGTASRAPPAAADDFVSTPSGLRILDVRKGTGPQPSPGDKVTVHWSGFTEGYQGKRIGNSSLADEPYEFALGASQAIPGIEEAVAGMRQGGVRRVEIPGERPQLGFPRERTQRFTNEIAFDRIYKYRYGPQPYELGGQRALDFVLDNPTLQDFNRTLLYDIKLLTVRSPS